MRQRYPNEPMSAYIMGTTTSLLMNHVPLAPGVPTRMHFTDDYYITRTIADKESGKPKVLNSRVFQVDELEGEDCNRTFSVLSQKLDAIFKPFLKDKGYLPYDFIITQIGEGFMKDWNVQVMKRPEE